MPTERVYVVDRIVGGWAVVVDEAGASTSVHRARFRTALGEGVVLRVPLDPGEEPEWEVATVDHAAGERLAEQGAAILRKLRDRDPGGDVAL